MINEILAYPLREEVDELVLSDRCAKRLLDTSKFNVEVCGYLVSVVYRRCLLPLGITASSIGETESVNFDNSYFPLHNEFLQRAKEIIPTLVTVQYHNHPKVKSTNLDQQTIKFLESGIQDGFYDYLRDYGIEPTLENVAAEELTRHLSEHDFLSAVGDLSILLTDTSRKGNFDHINAYRINKRNNTILRKLRVSKLESKDADIIKYHSEMVDKIDIIYQQNYKRERENSKLFLEQYI